MDCTSFDLAGLGTSLYSHRSCESCVTLSFHVARALVTIFLCIPVVLIPLFRLHDHVHASRIRASHHANPNALQDTRLALTFVRSGKKNCTAHGCVRKEPLPPWGSLGLLFHYTECVCLGSARPRAL